MHPKTVAVVQRLGAFAHETHEIPSGAEEVSWMQARWERERPVLVVDHYGWSAHQEGRCRAWTTGIVCVDDLANREHDCNILIDPNLGRPSQAYTGLVPANALVLTGAHHALLREQFARNRPVALRRRESADDIGTVLVSFGGGSNATVERCALDALAAAGFAGAVDLVVGPAGSASASAGPQAKYTVRRHVAVSNMAELMCAADAAVGAAGTGTLERFCVGLPAVVVMTAENQTQQFTALREQDLAETADFVRGASTEVLVAAVRRLAPAARRRDLAVRGAAQCDGLGAARAAAAIVALLPLAA